MAMCMHSQFILQFTIPSSFTVYQGLIRTCSHPVVVDVVSVQCIISMVVVSDLIYAIPVRSCKTLLLILPSILNHLSFILNHLYAARIMPTMGTGCMVEPCSHRRREERELLPSTLRTRLNSSHGALFYT